MHFKEPLKKKAKGKGGKKVTGSKQFVSPTSSVKMDKICKGFVPKETEKATNWAVRVFEQWRVERNRVASDAVKFPTCCRALSRYRSIIGCRGLLLKLVERMNSRIHLHLFQICWLVCIVSAENMIQIAPTS